MIRTCLILFFFPNSSLLSQTLVSGIINQYTAVSSVNAGTSTLSVGDASLFGFDDRVLLIQMQGTTISSGNSSTFGSISNVNGAGAYEFASVCEVNTGTNEVVLQKQLVNTYNPASVSQAGIQLVKVPQYVDVNIVGTLLAKEWDGTTGGVIAFEATGTVRLEADIDVSGAGFRGGGFENMNSGCGFLTNNNDWYYTQVSNAGGKKGEGIAAYISGREYGRGPQANGGGGGNDHNAGGAGGGQYNLGGQGGERSIGLFCPGNHEGEGGKNLSAFGYSVANPYAFMGGGGGAGHGNNNEGENGGDGAGIVMIRTQTFNGNNFSILANGHHATHSNSDGGSGGGAGGVIMLSADFYTADPFSLQAEGGNGGNTAINCEGPGGGGAGGVIWVSNALGAGISRSLSAGSNGIATGGGCGNSAQGALSGTVGAELTTLTLTEASTTTTCVLPIVLEAFEAERVEDRVELRWKTSPELAGTVFVIERSMDGNSFEKLHLISGKGEGQHTYTYTDHLPSPGTSWYRLNWREVDGTIGYSFVQEVKAQEGKLIGFDILSSPVQRGDPLILSIPTITAGPVKISIKNLEGKTLLAHTETVAAGRTTIHLDDVSFAAGLYLVSVQVVGRVYTRKCRIY
ncbi:MAG: hypothetical protein AAF587_14890 [Bacteroidota bacterium]